MQNDPIYHHYLPSFYQSRWAGEDGRLMRYKKVFGGKIDRRWVGPKVSGGDDYLYTDTAKPAGQDQWVEKDFMSQLDFLASDALTMMETDDPRIHSDPRLRSAWTRFLMSLMMRMPEDIETLNAPFSEKGIPEVLEKQYKEKQAAGAVETRYEFLKSLGLTAPDSVTISVLPGLIEDLPFGISINSMLWSVTKTTGPAEFLTSDRPIITEFSLEAPFPYILLPIGPKQLFIAANNIETKRQIESIRANALVAGVNRLIVGAAKKFVIARNDNHMAFVTEHFGKRPRPTLFEFIQSCE